MVEDEIGELLVELGFETKTPAARTNGGNVVLIGSKQVCPKLHRISPGLVDDPYLLYIYLS